MTEASDATTSVPAAAVSTPVLAPATLPTNSSEYQSSYQWKLPIVQPPPPKLEKIKTEYQREFTWKEQNTPIPSNASTPIPTSDFSRPPSSANINNLAPSRTDTPVMASTPEPPRVLSDDVLPQSTPITAPLKPANNITKHNGDLVVEPEDFNVAVERFMKTSANVSNNKWATGLRKDNERKESTLAASLDGKTKNIVALEANRLSKKNRCYSMYSLRDQLKTIETADELANPMVSEYKREFVDWSEYGYEVREESPNNRKEEPKLRRRGSWSAPLPEPLKWLGGLKNTLNKSEPQEKLQPTISDAKSIRSSNNRSEPKRPVTSAEFRDYHNYGYDEFSMSESRYNRLDKDGYYTTSPQQTVSNAYPSDNYYPARSSEERNHYDSVRTREPTTYSNRRDPEYDNFHTSRGAGLEYNTRRESSRLNDSAYDNLRYEREYDDHSSDRGYKDRRTDKHFDERLRNRNYDDQRDPEKVYYDHRSDKTYRDRTRDQYHYEETRREQENEYRSRNRVSQLIEQDRYSERGSHYGSDLDRYSDRGSQFGDNERYSNHSRNTDNERYSNHSRNTSYSSQASSLHKGLREELLTHSNNYTDNYRSSGSNSSVSTPSLPSTPREYDTSDPRWRKGSLSDPHIHKDDLYSQTLYSKPSQKTWNLEDDRWPGYNQSTKKSSYIDDEDEPIEFNSRFQRQSAYSTPPPLEGNYRGAPASRGRQMYSSPGRSPLASTPRSPTRSPSPGRRYHRGVTSPILSPTYPSRPDSRATSVSSHGTSMEEESAVMIDMLRAADNDLLKSLTQQMSVFRSVREREVTPKVGTVLPGTKKTTTGSKPGSKATTAKSSTTKSTTKSTSKSTPTKTSATAKNVRTTGLPTPGTKRTTTKNSLPSLTKGKGHKSTSSASSVSSVGSYSTDYRPNPTSFSVAREALNRAKMQVDQMLELVNNGGFEM